jgi:hypothetical protein
MGLFVAAFSLILMVRTEQMSPLLDRFLLTRWIYLGAFIRLMLGVALIASAHTVEYPRIIAALGWFMVLGGLLLVAVPQTFWIALGKWFSALPIAIMRVWLVFGLLFGAALLYIAFA